MFVKRCAVVRPGLLLGCVLSCLPSYLFSGMLDVSLAATASAAPPATTPAPADQWISKGRDWREQHHSPLADINRYNVARLGLAWSYDATPRRGRMARGLEATPLVVDGVLYTSLAWSEVVALEAASGRELWRYDPKADGAFDRKACCDVVNRGVAVARGRVYVGTLDGFLVSLDAATGRELWRVDTLIDRTRSYTVTGAPQVAGDVVVIGNGGGEFGVRGYFTAYDVTSGVLRWRFFTVPGDPAQGYEHPEVAAAAKTWDPKSSWESGGGGTAWDAMAYDPELNLLYVGTGNASPYPSWIRSPAGGDNLYLASILALDPRTGRLVWHYQTTPAESWDYTATQPFVLADLEIGGRQRPVLMQAPKNGFFYVLDRRSGELLTAQNFVHVNWASRIDLTTGRPVLTGQGWYQDKPKLVFPSQAGGHNWMPMSYSAQTGLVYLTAIDAPMLFTTTPGYRYMPGRFNMGSVGQLPPIPAEYSQGAPHTNVEERLIAWDPVHQREAWRVPLGGFWNGGTLSTDGGLVFQGTSGGQFVAYDAATGRELKKLETGVGIMAAPATYRVGGEQFVVVLAGYGGAMQKAFVPGVAARTYQNQAQIFAFRLGGGPVELPPRVETRPLPASRYPVDASSASIARGHDLYATHCARCHGGLWGDTPSGYPDLMRLPPGIHAMFPGIVLGGALAYNGMASFSDVLTAADVDAIQSFLKSETNRQIDAMPAP
jgi:quinohemoprotein ethanol dehydrogenase